MPFLDDIFGSRIDHPDGWHIDCLIPPPQKKEPTNYVREDVEWKKDQKTGLLLGRKITRLNLTTYMRHVIDETFIRDKDDRILRTEKTEWDEQAEKPAE